MPSADTDLAAVFRAMERARAQPGLAVADWGVATMTLEEVFVKIARGIGAAGGGSSEVAVDGGWSSGQDGGAAEEVQQPLTASSADCTTAAEEKGEWRQVA